MGWVNTIICNIRNIIIANNNEVAKSLTREIYDNHVTIYDAITHTTISA